MHRFRVQSSYADDKIIVASTPDVAIRHYAQAHHLNTGSPAPASAIYKVHGGQPGGEPTLH
ncbi:hypothetical protein [Aureimonas mangrovi]|uniref:hypothetical protein n=1 Tax=Aureimonas mangrovi TaxID=2758041 RepID=UPI00163D75E5|nr:hypothetical protein [Aureimonas mangrovi]